MSQCSVGAELRLFDEDRPGKDLEFKLQQRNVTSISCTCWLLTVQKKQETISLRKLFSDQPTWWHFIPKDSKKKESSKWQNDDQVNTSSLKNIETAIHQLKVYSGD